MNWSLAQLSNIVGFLSLGETYVYSTYHEVRNATGQLKCTCDHGNDPTSMLALDVIVVRGNAKITYQEVDIELAHELPNGNI
jgi:hypothetical protein